MNVSIVELSSSRRKIPGCVVCKGKLYCHHPEPPEILKKLWLGEGKESEVFRNNARVLNNTICLSSVKVTEQKFPGYNPSVIF